MSSRENFGLLPEDTLYHVGSYLTPGSSFTRRVATRVDPYDPQIITDLLEIGVDPSEILARERLLLRKIQELRGTLAAKIVDALYLLNPTQSWHLEIEQDLPDGFFWLEDLRQGGPEELSRLIST